MRPALALLTLLLTACAAIPPPPKPSPQGQNWRTHHQGYISAEVTATSSQQGNYQVTTIQSNAQRKLLQNTPKTAEKPRLQPNQTATAEALEASR